MFAATAFLCDSGNSPQTCAALASSGGGLRPIATGRVPQWLFVLTHRCGVGEPHAARQILCLALRAAGRTEAREPLGGKIWGTGTCGNAGAAFGLAVAFSDAKRGAVAVAMGDATIPRPAFREYLRSVLGHEYAYVIHAAATRRRLAGLR